MLRKKQSKKRFVSEINVVPYIDVMLVLLVIFMVTAPLLQQGVAVDLPRASANPIPPGEKESLVVSINHKGEYFLNISDAPGEPIKHDVLTQKVSSEIKKDPHRRVLVKGDKKVDYGRVVEAMVLLQRSGVPNVGLITQDLEERS